MAGHEGVDGVAVRDALLDGLVDLRQLGLQAVGQVGEARGGAQVGEVDFAACILLSGSSGGALAEGEGETAARSGGGGLSGRGGGG